MKIEDIDFILFHFQDQIQLFPRKMMTHSKPWQFSVSSIEEVFWECKNSGFIDCRINAYAEYTEYKEIIRQPPNFIFIDLDLANFARDRKKLDFRLKRTLMKIEEYNGLPTVLWTGNGYHIYLPINAIVLDQESIFSKDRFPNLFSTMGKYSNCSVSEVFLKYAEIFFTNGKADPLHKPKYKTCLIRIPGSYNSKLIQKGVDLKNSKVKTIQSWNGNKISIQLLLREFRRWLIQEEMNQKLKNSRKKKTFKQTRWSSSAAPSNSNINWIEKLLQTPLKDNRKYCLFHILVPYLINIKNLSHEEAVNILNNWLLRCSELRPLDFNPSVQIENLVRHVKNYKPISLSKTKDTNEALYHELKPHGISV